MIDPWSTALGFVLGATAVLTVFLERVVARRPERRQTIAEWGAEATRLAAQEEATRVGLPSDFVESWPEHNHNYRTGLHEPLRPKGDCPRCDILWSLFT